MHSKLQKFLQLTVFISFNFIFIVGIYASQYGTYTVSPCRESKTKITEMVPPRWLGNDRVQYVDNKTGKIIAEFKDVKSPGWFIDGLAVITFGDGKSIIATDQGKIIALPKVDSVGYIKEGLLVFVENKLFGYFDTTGKVAIESQFEWAGPFSEGLAIVEKKTKEGYKSGYINTGGKIVINYQFTDAKNFSDNVALVQKKGKWFYIDKTGKMVIDDQFDKAGEFFKDTAFVQKNGKWFYIDKTGKVILEPLKDDPENQKLILGLDSYCDGQIGIRLLVDESHPAWYTQNGKGINNFRDGLLDKTGKWLVKPQFIQMGEFVDGLAMVTALDGKVGFIDQSGAVVIPHQYDKAYDFQGGLAAVSIGSQMGFINKTGDLILPLKDYQVPNCWPIGFSEGLTPSYNSKTNLCGYMDTNGKIVIEQKFSSAEPFYQGRAFVAIKENQKTFSGLIDKKGNFIWRQESAEDPELGY